MNKANGRVASISCNTVNFAVLSLEYEESKAAQARQTRMPVTGIAQSQTLFSKLPTEAPASDRY